MSTQTTLLIILGYKFDESLPIDFDVPEENIFPNFNSYAEQNMDGNLKFLVGDDYTILGLPLSITYLDEGEYLNPYGIGTAVNKLAEKVLKDVVELRGRLNLPGNSDPKIYIFTHIT